MKTFRLFILASVLSVAAAYLSGCKGSGSSVSGLVPAGPGQVQATGVDQFFLTIHDATTQPAIQSVASTIPFGNLALGVIGTLTGIWSAWRHLNPPTTAQPPPVVSKTNPG